VGNHNDLPKHVSDNFRVVDDTSRIQFRSSSTPFPEIQVMSEKA
jgi:hypothetical protein